MNDRLVAALVVVGVLGVVYFAAFRVAGPDRGGRTKGASGSDDVSDEEDANEEADSADARPDDSASDLPPATRLGPRWDPGTTVALLAGATGVLTRNTTVFLLGVVGFAFAAYRYGTRPPEPRVSVERAIAERSPLPSEEVEVSLTVENVGEEPIPDLRVVDGVPEQLGVVSGSPRHCTSLRPGEEAEFSYEVRAHRGTHEFGATRLLARNVSGSAQRRWEQDADAPGRVDGDTITCETRADDVPLPADTSAYPGQVTTDSGGEGVEFYATREFQSADPMSRVDWKRFAKTRELTTIEFRESRAATVLRVVDGRAPAHVARRDGEPDAVELGEYAAQRLAEAFVRRNDRVGLARFDSTEAYVAPAGGDEQVARIRAELDDSPAPGFSSVGLFRNRRRNRADDARFDALRKRMPDAAQVVFVSPMADDYAVDTAKRFRAYGHSVTVVSPDPTGTDTPGGEVEHVERAERLAEIRSGGIRVVDWSPDEPIRAAIGAATARWSG